MASSPLPAPAINLGRCIPSKLTASNSRQSRITSSLSSQNLSRRLSLFHFATAVSQSQLLGSKAPSSLQLDKNILDSSAYGNVAQASPIDENALNWVKNDNRRLLHVVYRVGNLDRTIKFYTECLGMKVLRKRDISEEKYSNAFLGYGPEESHFAVELTYNYGIEQYDIGSGFGYFGVAVEDVAQAVDLVKTKGGNIAREPGPVKGGSYVSALIEDPDGYKFKLQERSPAPEPFCRVMLRIGDLDRSINFYTKAFGLKLLHKWDYPEDKYSVATMGYSPEDTNAVLELNYNYGVKEYDKEMAMLRLLLEQMMFTKQLKPSDFVEGQLCLILAHYLESIPRLLLVLILMDGKRYLLITLIFSRNLNDESQISLTSFQGHLLDLDCLRIQYNHDVRDFCNL